MACPASASAGDHPVTGAAGTFPGGQRQIFICGSVVDEEIAARFLAQKATFLPKIQAHTRTNFEIVHGWMERNPAFEWVEPRGGTVCFPRIKEEIDLDIDRFYRFLNEKYKTFVGPGHWFEMNRRTCASASVGHRRRRSWAGCRASRRPWKKQED
jgi:aspartate/methionine/tyrosine aminotransferase